MRYRRAMMLLASAGGNRVPMIAQLVQADEDTVRDVIHRSNEIGLACLDPRWAGDRPAYSPVTTRTSSFRRPPPDPLSSASTSPAGRSANPAPTCAAFTDASSASAVKPHGACSSAAASPSSAPRPERSRPTLSATPSSTAASTSWSTSRTVSSPSMSSGPWGSGPPQGPAGRSRASPTVCRRPTTAPTA